ncbi:putative zinc finger protein At1g68190 isoform X4 [Helianthus annuus]|uniref:putative zinc finger protein At1g68190 isoform X4 n=1 Tax=Helianthus annuus TaxID=4232 RepID=UPI001652E893|nr:putative zinc finger protein At1g68190 isoform X4 [Helianthus annuus]
MMDRYCEYCVNLRSVVYCKADAAYLCLSCDTKVHLANPLSKRHHRTLICDTCRRRPTYVRCYDHQRFMCRGCDLSQHDASSQHIKRVMSSYAGCPSARDLGALWGFDLSRFGDGSSTLDPKYGSNSCASSNTSGVSLETNVHVKEICGGMQSVILQQLVDLLRYQTTSDVDQIPSVIRCEDHKVDPNDVDQTSQQFWLGEKHPEHHEMILDPCSSPFTQLDRLESETDETDLPGDPFWQCKSRVPSGQLWSQNMQDLGVCEEEPSCLDDLNIPDIDLTFRNFEELFRIEQEPTRPDQSHHQRKRDTLLIPCHSLTQDSALKAVVPRALIVVRHPRVDHLSTMSQQNWKETRTFSIYHQGRFKTRPMWLQKSPIRHKKTNKIAELEV